MYTQTERVDKIKTNFIIVERNGWMNLDTTKKITGDRSSSETPEIDHKVLGLF